MNIEEISKKLYKRYDEIEIELNKRWSDPYSDDPLVLERRDILVKADVIIEVLGFNHRRDWVENKGIKK